MAELKTTIETKRAEAFAWSGRAIALADAKANLEKLATAQRDLDWLMLRWAELEEMQQAAGSR